jgi:mannose-6-phosphate isomerase
LGFKEEVSKEQLKELFDKQDIKGMEALMHKIPVEAGEVYIITGGTPHAIGPGCFLLEIQEPTDYTISLEKCNTLGEKLPDFLCHQGLGFDKMFDCFHYTKHSLNELIKEFKLEGSTLAEDENHSYKQVISYETTTCFMLNRLRVKDKYERKNIGRPYAFAVTAGEGKIAGIDVKTGDCLFVPAKTADFFISNSGEDTFELLECLPPEMKNK